MSNEVLKAQIAAHLENPDNNARDFLIERFFLDIARRSGGTPELKLIPEPDNQDDIYTREANSLLELVSPPEVALRLNMTQDDFENAMEVHPDRVAKTVDADLYPGMIVYNPMYYSDVEVAYVFDPEGATAESIVVTYKGDSN